MEVHQEIKTQLPYDPAILLLGLYTKQLKAWSWRDIRISAFTAALFTIAKKWKQPTCPSTGGWITKRGIYKQWNII